MDLTFYYYQLQYQFSITVLIQNYILGLHISVDDALAVQISQSFNHTRCVEPGAVVVQTSSETTMMKGDGKILCRSASPGKVNGL